MSDKKRFIKSTIIGMLCGMLASVILTCLAALILSHSGMMSDQILGYIAAGLLAGGAFVGGFVSAKLNRGAGLVAGAAAGGAMLAVTVLISAFKGDADFTVLFLIKTAALLLGGIAGGILAVKEKRKIGF